MEDNNNGRGIFYGVIGVATLVVAIIGATFAYFSATAVSNNGVNVGTATLTLEMLNEKRQFSKALIPVDSTINSFGNYIGMKDGSETVGVGTCSDNDGNAICGVYEFTISNPSPTVSQTVYGSITVTDVSEGLTHMKYAVFKGSVADIEDKTVSGTNTKFVLGATNKTVGTAALGETVIAPKLFEVAQSEGAYVKDDWGTWTEQTLAPSGQEGSSQTYTVVFWLEEAEADNVGEAGKVITAQITFDTGTGKGITGNLTALS